MADINKSAEWITARLMEVGNATEDGLHILLTDDSLNEFMVDKVTSPRDNPNGNYGQLLMSQGDGNTQWTDYGTPTDAQVGSAVSSWLNDHPEATTTVQDDSLTTAKYQNGSVTTDKIADLNITEGKIKNGAITTAKLGTSAVTTAKINNGAVTTDKITDSAVTTAKIQDGAVTEAKLATNLQEFVDDVEENFTHGRDLQIQRYGRFLDKYGYESRDRRLYGQSCTFYDNKFYIVGSYNSNANQGLSVWDSTGVYISSKEYTELGHANSITALGDYLYVAQSTKVSVVDRTTLNYVRDIDGFGTALYSVHAISEYDGSIYICGRDKTITTKITVLKITDLDSGTFDVLCTFDNPRNTVVQGFTVLGNFGYFLRNRSNMIYKVDLSTGDIVFCYYIPDGDGIRPVGEPEDLFKINGDIYLHSACYYNDKVYDLQYIAMTQCFETDLVKPLQKNLENSYMQPLSSLTIIANGNLAYSFNPAFSVSTYEEACQIANYFHYGHINASNLGNGYILLMNGVYSFAAGAGTRRFDVLDIQTADVIFSQASPNAGGHVFVSRSRAMLKVCSPIESDITLRFSDVQTDFTTMDTCTGLSVLRSNLTMRAINSGVNPDMVVSMPENISNSVRIESIYYDNILNIAKVTLRRVHVKIQKGNNPIEVIFENSELASTTDVVKTVEYNPYDQVVLNSGVLKIRNATSQELETLSGVDVVITTFRS